MPAQAVHDELIARIERGLHARGLDPHGLGPTIDYRHLSRLVGERCWDVAAELHRCCTLGILVERPGGWTFAHPAVGHALAAAVPAEERRRLRQASARAAATLVLLVSAAA